MLHFQGGKDSEKEIEDKLKIVHQPDDYTLGFDKLTFNKFNEKMDNGNLAVLSLAYQDFASKESGGQIIEKGPFIAQSSGMLSKNDDRYVLFFHVGSYMITPCLADKNYFIVSFNEEINPDQFMLLNKEQYCSNPKYFTVYLKSI